MKKSDITKSLIDLDPSSSECPFREFRDNELWTEFWGLGSVAFKSAVRFSKGAQKLQGDTAWVDDQIQPLPRAVRKRFRDWVRAEELGKTLYDAEVIIFDDNSSGKMSCAEIQFSHYQVLQMSSFCRRVLSMCYILERAEDFTVEHQWENFVFNVPPEGWRARYHIYSPGLKNGGGQQHRPTLSKNGCYLVRLFYVGAWRCVWVSDQVPVDARECPLLPFAPSFYQNSLKSERLKQAAPISQTQTVVLWPLLICKALLKLAAPRMDSDDYSYNYVDEPFNDFDILHALTGAMNLTYVINDANQLWKRICEEVPQFSWDEDDETLTSTIKTKTKKPSNKEVLVFKHRSLTSVLIGDTGNVPPYTLPGITPAFQMELLVVMARDLPLKKPLPEPEVALWKHYRWVDWAKKHGLYEAYDCPRTRFLKMSALLKLSLAPHLLDVQSTDSITFCFREEHAKTNPVVKKSVKAVNRSTTTNQTISPQLKGELRDWVQFEAIQKFIKNICCLYYPSMYQFCSIASNPPVRITKLSPNKEIDVPASKTSPIYLQIDGPDQNCLRISCGMIHPRVLLHAGMPKGDYVEPGYVLVEKFDWFDDCELPKPKTYLQTRGYDGTEIPFQPGRHYCRLWIHSRLPWHVMLVSDSTIHVGTRDVIQVAALRECPWAAKFLNALGAAFQNFMRTNKSTTTISSTDRDFYKSYLPDLEWDPKIVGQSKNHLHWMFRQALQSLLKNKLPPFDYTLTCRALQYCFDDPEFGLFKKTASFVTAKDLIIDDPCFCPTSDTEELEIFKMNYNELMKGNSDNDVNPSDNLVPRVCEAARENMPCGTLKTLRDIIIRRHEAATRIQALWRGIRARNCVRTRVAVSPEIFKCLMDNAFGNLEALASLMNEFFKMFPGAKSAFSVASALTRCYGLKQHFGVSNVTPQCVWIPLFQGVFYCHAPVKVHLDLQSTMGMKKINSTVKVYDNNTRRQLPLLYTAHMTLNLTPNSDGYTVFGHATFQQASNITSEVHWQLNVMSSVANTFHICDNELDGCKELPMLSATKLHVDEIFLPNERNILGGIQITVSRHESISFRASATSDDLEMVAILQVMSSDGKVKEIERCYGQGELYWPYIRLELLASGLQVKSMSQADVTTPQSEPQMFGSRSQRNVRYGRPTNMSAGIKARSAVKVKEQRVPHDLTTYIIEVRGPKGWPLSLTQWKRVIDVQNKQEYKSGTQSRKSLKDKISKDKDRIDVVPSSYLQFSDAYVELECSLGGDTGAVAKRDDTRDQRFASAVKSWEGKELGRNAKGALIRQEFRKEFLENTTISKVVFIDESSIEATESAEIEKETLSYLPRNQQGPTPAASPISTTQFDYKHDGVDMMGKETKTDAKFLFMPDELKDKFKPLDFIKSCTRERTEDECVILTSEMLEAAKKGREMDINTAYERMNQLQIYNEVQVLEAQKTRCDLLETLFVDSQWCPALAEALEARDNTVVTDVLNKSASVMRKKQDIKTK